MDIISAGLSDVGLQREHNEDSYQILSDFQLYVVADGMGGHRAGDVASQMATEAMTVFFKATQSEETTWPFHFDPSLSIDENRLITAIKVANRKIFEASARNRDVRGMGTTVVSLCFSKKRPRVYVAHVGDSRAYRIRDGKLVQLTRDHSLLNDYLLVMPDMTQAQQDELPRNVITRALGMQDSVVVDLVPEKAINGDRYLLCSDGLSGMIADEEICRIVTDAGDDMEKAAKDLVAKANANGGEDNVTVVVMRVENVPEDTDDDAPETRRRDMSLASTLEGMPVVPDPSLAKTQELPADVLPKESEYRAQRTTMREKPKKSDRPPAKKRSSKNPPKSE